MSLKTSTSKKNYSNNYKKTPSKDKLKKLLERLKKGLPSFKDIKRNIPSKILEDLKKK